MSSLIVRVSKSIRIRLEQIAVAAGKYTAFTDKSTGGYEVARGPSGTGVSDYSSLEIKTTEPQYLDATGNSDGFVGTGYPPYDAQKVTRAPSNAGPTCCFRLAFDAFRNARPESISSNSANAAPKVLQTGAATSCRCVNVPG